MAETAGVEIAAVPPTPVVPETQKVEPPKEDTSQKLSDLIKKEKMIYRTKQNLSQKEKLILEKEKALAEREAKLATASTNPIEALKTLGWTYDQITEYMLQNKVPVDKHITDVRNELEQFKKQQLEEKQKAAEEAKQAAEAQATQVIDSFKVQINDFITTNKDTYELVNLHEAQDIVFATIETHFENTKKVLTIQEATDLVEKYLEDRIEQSTKTKKLASKYRLPEPNVEKKTEPTFSEPKTLTNSMTTGSSPGLPQARNEEDRIKRALAALDGKR